LRREKEGEKLGPMNGTVSVPVGGKEWNESSWLVPGEGDAAVVSRKRKGEATEKGSGKH